MRFRTKTILGVAAIEIVMLAILVGSVLHILRDSNEAELERRIRLGSQLLAAAAKDAVIAQDLATLDSLLAEAKATGQLEYVRIVDASGRALAEQGTRKPSASAASAPADGTADAGLHQWETSITAGGVVYGRVQMGVSKAPLELLLQSSQKWAFGIALVELILVALFSWVLGTYLSHQLVRLRKASEAVAAGDFSHRLTVSGDDELAQTAHSFNRMAEQLGQSHELISAENRLRLSAQEKLEHALANSEDRALQLDEIFALMPDGLVAFDRQGRVKHANWAFLLMTGLEEERVIGQTQAGLDDLLRGLIQNPEQWGGSEPCFVLNGLGNAPSPAPVGDPVLPINQAQMRARRLTLTRPRPLVLELLGFESQTRTLSRLIYIRDVTQEVAVTRMKNEFLAHAAHELRTPMTSVYGFSELLSKRDLDEKTRKDLAATIHRQAAWLIEIINELLDLSRIESQQGQDFQIEAVPLASAVEEALQGLHTDPGRWPLRLECSDTLPPARADSAKLRQMLTNVIGNAIKYSPAGGSVTISGVTKVAFDKGWVGIAVADRGIGMTQEQVARVGERFYRADTSGNVPGSGLGMAIVKETLALLGGHVEIASRLGVGTTVTIWLPQAVDAMAGPGQQVSVADLTAVRS